MMVTAGAALKGKVPFTRMPVNLSGDAAGKRDKDPEEILKRMAAGLEIVFFVSKRGETYEAFGFTNGTWFHMIGEGDKPEDVTWLFTNCERYLRRTFKGTTEELKKVVADGLSGKKAPPPADEKEPPGLGPEIKPDDKPKDPPLTQNDRTLQGPRSQALLGNAVLPSSAWRPGHESPPRSRASQAGIPKQSLGTRGNPPLTKGGPASLPFAVVPTFVLIGPLAILAALFPTVFGGLAILAMDGANGRGQLVNWLSFDFANRSSVHYKNSNAPYLLARPKIAGQIEGEAPAPVANPRAYWI